ncbi:MAG: endonuclease/exonuclease/phosphatase family protein [Pirellulales bacterium]|nr:endonuclease/exonuclease/phosphatase family protein [Pirellulales bacterium]
MHFRLVTYNIHKGIGGADRRYRLGRVVETLRHYAPDFALLQEVDDGVPRSRHHRQVELLAHALGMRHYAFQRNVKLKRGAYGNAILSRFPLHDVSHVNLTVPMKKQRRALVTRCRLSSDGHTRTLLLANVHLGLSGFERQVQLRRLLKNNALVHVARRTPVVLAGDYNDVWGKLGKGVLQPAGFQAAAGNLRTFPAIMPLRALDRVYHRGPLRVKKAFAGHTLLSRQASDHLPLIVDFQLQVG